MTSGKYYLQPLGFLRGSFASEAVEAGTALPLVGGPGAFTAFLFREREMNGPVRQSVMPVGAFDAFLGNLPPEIAGELRALRERITSARPALQLPDGRLIDWDRPLIQGILNVTPDSFSDGGLHNSPDRALDHAREMMAQGADIIDIGGESTRPGAEAVSIDEELERVLPVIKKLAGTGAIASLDTRNAAVMRQGLEAGAQIINDVSALAHDEEAVSVLQECAAPVILMHAQGTPQTMQRDPVYDDVLLDVYDYLEQRLEFCQQNGIARDRLIVDPGIGFGKTVDHNAALLQGLALFHGLGVPILLGASRKRFIEAMSRQGRADRRLGGSLSVAQLAWENDIQIVRVHDVPETVQMCDVWSYIGSM